MIEHVVQTMGVASTSTRSSVPAELVGRDHEMARLTEVLDRAPEQGLRVVRIQGEPGIGKTRLLEELCRRAETLGQGTVVGTAVELERALPLHPFVEAFEIRPDNDDPLRRQLGQLLLGEAPSSVIEPQQLILKAIEQFLELVEEASATRPLLLCLDDLQWADEASLALVQRLTKRLSYEPITVVLAHRDAAGARTVDALVAQLPREMLVELPLGPLSGEGALALAGATAMTMLTSDVQTQLERANGNPFFIIELVSLLGQPEAPGGVRQERDPQASSPITATVLHHVDSLAPAAAKILELGAILGSPFSIRDLAAVAGSAAAQLAAPLEEACRAGLLDETTDGIRFRHDLVREAIYTNIPGPARSALHLEAGRALARVGASAVKIAKHMEVGAQTGDHDAVEWLRQAGRDHLHRAPVLALELFEKAVALADDHYEERDELLTELAVASLWGGQPARGEELARRMLMRTRDPDLLATLRSTLFRSLLVQGRAFEFGSLSEEELSVLPEHARARVLAEAAYFMAEARHDPHAESHADGSGSSNLAADVWDRSTDRQTQAESLAREALVLGERLEDEPTQCLSLCAMSSVLDTRGAFSGALELSRRAVDIAERAESDEAHRYTPHFNLGMQLLLTDQVEAAEKVVLTGLQRAEAAGVMSAIPLYQHLLARIYFVTGRWDDAVAQWEAAISLGEEIGTKMIVSDVAPAFLAQIALHRGDVRAAEKFTRSAETGSRQQDPAGSASPLSLWPGMLLLEATGHLQQAASLAASIHNVARAQRWLAVYRVVGVDLARVFGAVSERGLADGVVDAMDRLALGADSSSTRAAALLARGLAYHDRESLSLSVATYMGSPLVFERAASFEAAGAALVESGGVDEGADLLLRAVEAYEELGAARLVSRVDAQLRHAKRPRRLRRATRPATGWEALTKTEVRVAALVGEGMSNPAIARELYISPRTVHAHMSHIFTKLNVRSRAQVAVEAARRET